jgi:hypothetical protein
MTGVHLPIGIHLRDDFRPESGSTEVAGDRRRSHSLIALELDEIDPRILEVSDDRARRIVAPVIDHNDIADERGHARDDARHRRRRPIRGDDDRDDRQLDRNDRCGRG